MSKKEVEELLGRVERDYQRVLEQNRVEWLQKICREAKESFSFKSLGELIAFMFDHAGDIQLKEG